MSSDSPLGVDEVFLGSCKEVYNKRAIESPVSPTAILSPIINKFEKLGLDEDKDVSDAERLSAFYLNAAYDFYGTPSGALCVYKNGDA